MNLDKLRELVYEACDACDAQHDKHGQSGKQGKMARTDLVSLAKDAQELVNMFGDDADLPEWVESKITKASDYINTVRKYIGGEIVRQQGGLMENKNAIKLARKKQNIEKINQIMLNKMQASEVEGLLMILKRDYGHVDSSGEEGGLEEEYFYLEDATYDDGEVVEEDFEFWDDVVVEAEYRGRKVKLNKPMRGDVKKFKVFVKDPKTGNVKKVNYGDPNMRIKKSNPKRRKSFRARHNCDNPGPKTKARYWSCKKW
tara:strand:- start:240 stop:1010 length:771 start_codon:yes stop_codon:yes gene_type:complete